MNRHGRVLCSLDQLKTAKYPHGSRSLFSRSFNCLLLTADLRGLGEGEGRSLFLPEIGRCSRGVWLFSGPETEHSSDANSANIPQLLSLSSPGAAPTQTTFPPTPFLPIQTPSSAPLHQLLISASIGLLKCFPQLKIFPPLHWRHHCRQDIHITCLPRPSSLSL